MRARADARAPRCAGGERALLVAAKEGREDLVKLLLDCKAEVDARDAVCFFPPFPLSFLYVYVFCMYTLESDNISKGLQVKAKSNGGTSKGSEGVFPTYLISKIDDLSLQKDTANEIAVQTKSGGGISKGSEGVFQTYEISGIDKHLKNHLVQIYFKLKQ